MSDTAGPAARAPVRDSQTWLVMLSALTIAGLYAADAWWLRPPAEGLPVGRLLVVALIALPLRGVWMGRGRAGFWYALMCTLFVAHAMLLALDDRTRAFGLALLAASSVLFVVGCAFARRRGLRSA